jgi:hypothetical protein
MGYKYSLYLTDKEMDTLAILSKRLNIPIEKVLTQALHQYHLNQARPMSHHINIFLAKSTKVSIQPNPNYATHPLKHGLVAIIPKQTYEATQEILKGADYIAHITTDYYGGVGAQTAVVWNKGQLVYKGNTAYQEDTHCTDRPINEALRYLGIIADPHLDEFDTVGLGQYRSNEDFLNIPDMDTQTSPNTQQSDTNKAPKLYHAHQWEEAKRDHRKTHPEKGDYWWCEHFNPVLVVLDKIPGHIIVCRKTKDADDNHWTWDLDKIELLTQQAFTDLLTRTMAYLANTPHRETVREYLDLAKTTNK